MKVCIVGWYGTETIGDRAILAGILCLLAEEYLDFEVVLGSLNPFFSERTLREDQALWDKLTGRPIKLSIFDSSRRNALMRAVRKSDLLLLGGGPIMDLREMHMLDFAFQYARRRKVRSAVFGCGIGPLKKKIYQKIAGRIITNADTVLLRDQLSAAAAQELTDIPAARLIAAIDPAAWCALRFKEVSGEAEVGGHVSINLRDLSYGYAESGPGNSFLDLASDIVRKAADHNEDGSIRLIPHHYFSVGGDDRVILNQIKYRLSDRNIRVQNDPLSLEKTMQLMQRSALCIGMRFHFILLSSLLNGHCRIVNYTGSETGKIAGFLQDFDEHGFYNNNRLLQLDGNDLQLEPFNVTVSVERFISNRTSIVNATDRLRSALPGRAD